VLLMESADGGLTLYDYADCGYDGSCAADLVPNNPERTNPLDLTPNSGESRWLCNYPCDNAHPKWSQQTRQEANKGTSNSNDSGLRRRSSRK